MGPWYLIEIHSETGKLFHILIHHDPNSGEIVVLKFAMCIVFNIFKRMWRGGGGGGGGVISTASCTFGASKANAVMSNHRIQYKYTAKSVHCFTFWSITALIQAISV